CSRGLPQPRPYTKAASALRFAAAVQICHRFATSSGIMRGEIETSGSWSDLLFGWPEGEGDGGNDAQESGDVIPRRQGFEIKEGKNHKNREGDYFLHDF